jgi:hypothetical protein
MSFAKGNRKDKTVNMSEECLIYIDPLEDFNEVTRYTFCYKDIVGGQTSARRNPTGTILGNQAIKQEANAYINIKQ